MQLHAGGKNIIVDPFISLNPKASQINIDSLVADYILLTHAHYDHLLDLDKIVENTGAKIIANHEIATFYSTHKKYACHAIQQGGTYQFDFGKLKAVNAIHSSSFPDGTYGGNPLGFVMEADGKAIYIAGDTALTFDMKLIPMFFKLDLAVLPVGGNYTMDVQEAVVAAEFIECDKIVGVHFDTSELIVIDHEKAKDDFKKKNKELILLNVLDELVV
jgi:L-ascorbate metabolism protein UlaG (beta-lactamase superfamily)